MTTTAHEGHRHEGQLHEGHLPAAYLNGPEDVGGRQKLGVILFIVADVAFVLSMIFAYVYLRALNTEGGWIPADGGRTAGVGFGWLIAGVVVLSWAAYRWGEVAARTGNKERLVLGSLVATVLIAVDLALQVYQIADSGLRPHDGSYASSFLALSGYHAFHLVLTLFIGLGLWNRARLGLFTQNHWHVRLVGYWWTWVAVSALLTAATTSLTTSPHVVR